MYKIRSYEVTIGNTTYRRNRRQLIQAGLLSSSDTMLSEAMNVHQQPESQSSNPEDSPQTSSSEHTEVPTTTTTSSTIISDDTPPPRRSGRTTRAPSWMADYVPSSSAK